MRALVGIPYTENIESLSDLVKQIKEADLPGLIPFVIDNSKEGELYRSFDLAEVVRPPVPFSFSQTVNLLHRLTVEYGCEALWLLGEDTSVQAEHVRIVQDAVYSLEQRGARWGAVLATSPEISVYQVSAIRELGPLDTVFPQYLAIEDYRRRLALSDYESLPVPFGGGQAPSEAAPELSSSEQFIRQLMNPLFDKYYIAKWGGLPGAERFKLSFGKFPLNPVSDYLSTFAPSEQQDS